MLGSGSSIVTDAVSYETSLQDAFDLVGQQPRGF